MNNLALIFKGLLNILTFSTAPAMYLGHRLKSLTSTEIKLETSFLDVLNDKSWFLIFKRYIAQISLAIPTTLIASGLFGVIETSKT